MPIDERPRLRLKNGSEVDARAAYTTWIFIAALNDRYPEEAKLMLALVEGKLSLSKASEARAYLRHRFVDWFDDDGQFTPLVNDVINTALRHTADGVTVVNPFDLASQHDRDVFEEVEETHYRRAEAFFRLGRGNDSGRGSP